MSLSTATFFYGITVNMIDLCFAAQAHAVIAPTLLAVDLIIARRSSGRLQAGGAGRNAVCEVPVEVWSVVKEHVAREAVADKEDELVRSVDDRNCMCDGCIEVAFGKQAFSDKRFFLEELVMCNERFDRFMAKDGLPGVFELHDQSVKDFLASYALCKPHVDVLNEDDRAHYDLDAACTVGIPLARRDDDGPSSCIVAVDPYDMAPIHRIHRFSPSAFDLPADAHERFRRLLATFPTIRPVGLAEGTVISAQEKARRQGLEPMTGRERDEEEKAAASTPSWLLVSQGLYCP
ncbi:hypothetical protein JCM8208_007158 [Rhodotorula glutinis]